MRIIVRISLILADICGKIMMYNYIIKKDGYAVKRQPDIMYYTMSEILMTDAQ